MKQLSNTYRHINYPTLHMRLHVEHSIFHYYMSCEMHKVGTFVGTLTHYENLNLFISWLLWA